MNPFKEIKPTTIYWAVTLYMAHEDVLWEMQRSLRYGPNIWKCSVLSGIHHISQRRKSLLWTWKRKWDLWWFLNAGSDMVGRKKERRFDTGEKSLSKGIETAAEKVVMKKKCHWATCDFVKAACLTVVLISFLFEASGQGARSYLRRFHGRGETQSGPWKWWELILWSRALCFKGAWLSQGQTGD